MVIDNVIFVSIVAERLPVIWIAVVISMVVEALNLFAQCRRAAEKAADPDGE